MLPEQLTLFPSPEPFLFDAGWFQVVLGIWRQETPMGTSAPGDVDGGASTSWLDDETGEETR